MAEEILQKKLDQMAMVIRGLEKWLACSLEDFKNNEMVMRAAERNFQLMVDIACDINGQILLERGVPAPDTYSQSFIAMNKIGIVSLKLARILVKGAKMRNILVHEYDFIESDEIFFNSAKKIIPAYKEYATIIYHLIKKK